jgi:beta-lactam-binding protein with PASTA domain/tRNA A-37 threonylcarbamoyl transferase component Bud32
MSRMSTEVGRVLGQRYRIVTPIGMGASAQVFLADDARLRRRVAVKMLHAALAGDADFLRRFRAEARAAAALSHPNVVAVYDWGDDEVAFIVTEFLAGGSLRALLDGGQLLSPGQALLVGLEAARALDYAHRRGFVHRDIKPANLLFGEEGRLRVADFGLARALAEAAWTEPQGAVLGTARYASPELATGEQLTGKADVYSLALVIIEAVTGQVPFTADTTLGTLMARVGRPIAVPEELGPLRHVLERAGAPDPADRIDARTMAGGLLAAARGLGSPDPLPLAGALPRDDVAPVDADPTLHGPMPADEGATDPDVVDLRDDDLDLEPPDWVSAAEPALAFLGDASAEEESALDAVFDQSTAEQPVAEQSAVEQSVAGQTTAGQTTAGQTTAGQTVTGQKVTGQTVTDLAVPVAESPSLRLSEPATVADSGDGAIDTKPGRRRRWPWIVPLALLLVAVGVAAALLLIDRFSDSGPTYAVPNFGGQPEAAARRRVARFRWKVATTHERRDGTTAGQVIRSVPPAGDRLERDGRLVLVISDGNTLATVPTTVAGQPAATVTARLTRLGLVPKPTLQFDEKVPKGAVIRLAPGTPTRLPKEHVVGLIVSAGPKPRTVPSGLVGLSEAAARAKLASVQLVATSTLRFDDTVPAGQVSRAEPASGTKLARGSTVALSVSKGPDLVTVPYLNVRTIDGAIAALRRAGLVPGNVSGPAAGRPVSSTPSAGRRVRRGGTVNIHLG